MSARHCSRARDRATRDVGRARRGRHGRRARGARSAPGRGWTPAAIAIAVAVACGPVAGQQPGPTSSADPRLLEAIDWYTGVAGRVDDERARSLLLSAAADGSDPLSTMWIARVHSRGRMGFEQDEGRARAIAGEVVDRVRALAASGDVEAAFLMGTAHDEGLGATVDFEEAARWYRRAGARNHVLAVHNLGNMFRAGRGVARSDERAVIWWLRAARAGDAITQLRLGESFEQGLGVEADLEAALAWYGRAAEAGNAQARAAVERLGERR